MLSWKLVNIEYTEYTDGTTIQTSFGNFKVSQTLLFASLGSTEQIVWLATQEKYFMSYANHVKILGLLLPDQYQILVWGGVLRPSQHC